MRFVHSSYQQAAAADLYSEDSQFEFQKEYSVPWSK
jgi:hypothetical protein